MRPRLFVLLAIVALIAAFAPARPAYALYGDCHVVRPGETLTTIAARYGVTISAIMQLNGLHNPDLIYIGQCLRIPAKTPAKPVTGCTTHVVQRGEYLRAIAARYHVSVAAIVDLNNLRNPNLIYPGQRLKIKCTGGSTPPPPAATGIWRGQYWNNRALSGNAKFIRNSKAIDFSWGTGGPGGGVGSDNFSVRWTSKQSFAAGKYRFHVLVDDGARLFLDGVLLIDQWHDAAGTEYTADKQLSAGVHSFQLDYYEHTGQATVKFWTTRLDTAPTTAWLAEYFGNRMFEPPALVSRLEPGIDYDWGLNPPVPGFRTDDFAVRWTRDIFFEAGTYRFTATVDDGVQVLIDGTAVIDEWHDSSGATYVKDVKLTRGTHRVRVKYYEAGGAAKIKFSYAKAGPAATVFQGEYFNNTIAQGTAIVVRNDNGINFNWGNTSPAPAAGVTADYFSVEWNGTFHFAKGTYRFTATMDDGMRLFVDNALRIDQWHDGSVRTAWVDVALEEGNHWIKVEYYERTGNAVAKLSWAKR